jgi:hypothetical protein
MKEMREKQYLQVQSLKYLSTSRILVNDDFVFFLSGGFHPPSPENRSV